MAPIKFFTYDAFTEATKQVKAESEKFQKEMDRQRGLQLCAPFHGMDKPWSKEKIAELENLHSVLK